MPVRPIAWSIIVSVLCLPLRSADAQEYTPEQLEAFFLDQARSYQFGVEGAASMADLQLQEQPLLKWTNPVRLQNKGSLFVWTDAGRPQVLASIFSFSFSGRVQYRHEVYSLLDQPMQASLSDRVVWEPVATDAQWKSLPDAAAPQATAPRRLSQMRRFARMFEGKVSDKQDTGATPLKLMPQPLMRYSSEKHGIIDGGIFGLSVATDPEAYLLIEAYEDANHEAATEENGAADPHNNWRYAIVPSTYFAVTLSLNGTEVWSQKRNMPLQLSYEGQMPLAARPYFTFFSRDRLPDPETLQNLVDQTKQ